MIARNPDELKKQLQSAINTSLLLNVSPWVEKKLKEHIVNDVYSFPDSHQRGWERTGGLLDDGNIISDILSPGVMLTYDTAAPSKSVFGSAIKSKNSTLLSEWINNGQWMDLWEFVVSRYTNKTYRAPRPFVDNTQREVDQNMSEIIALLKKSL